MSTSKVLRSRPNLVKHAAQEPEVQDQDGLREKILQPGHADLGDTNLHVTNGLLQVYTSKLPEIFLK